MESLFQRMADETLAQVKATYAQRGLEYEDGYAVMDPLALQATLKRIGVPELHREQLMAVIAAALVDVKYWRLMGGYKEDTAVDGIAYTALWVGLMKQPMVPALKSV